MIPSSTMISYRKVTISHSGTEIYVPRASSKATADSFRLLRNSDYAGNVLEANTNAGEKPEW